MITSCQLPSDGVIDSICGSFEELCVFGVADGVGDGVAITITDGVFVGFGVGDFRVRGLLNVAGVCDGVGWTGVSTVELTVGVGDRD